MSEEKDQKKELHIGKTLKDARQAKGMTLDDLQQATKIQKRYLIAIEDEKFDELPGDFYVRAFVKQYANTVGLNGSDLLKDYDEQLPETKTASYSDHLDEAVETRRGRQHQVTADRIDQLRHYLPTIIVVLVVVVILVGIWLTAIVRNHQNSSTKIDSSSVKVSGESSHKTKKKAKKTTKKSDKNNIKLSESSRNNNTVVYHSDSSLKASTKLTISNKADGYNSVTVDGTQRLAKQMGANSKSTVVIAKNAQSITIRIGNPSQTKIKLGNKTINFTQNNRYPNTRTVTITFGSAASSSSTNNSNSNQNQTTNNNANTGNSRTTNNTTTTNNTNNNRPATSQQPATGGTTNQNQTNTNQSANTANNTNRQ